MTTTTLAVARTRAELAAVRAALPGRTAVVMTMGALHAGHAALVEAAREAADTVVATVFVNPLQFGDPTDLARYPRTESDDLALLDRYGVDAVFAPAYEAVYPQGTPTVRIDPGPLGEALEGASRPGHFAGVLTVVAKLLHLVDPDVAVFGEKDYQQLVLVRRMVDDLDLRPTVLAVPTVRDADGLALSSRNIRLDPEARRAALALPRALRVGASAAVDGPTAVRRAAQAVLDDAPEVALDYLALTGPDLQPQPAAGPARLLVAAEVGGVRLIDNVALTLPAGKA